MYGFGFRGFRIWGLGLRDLALHVGQLATSQP